MYMVKVDRDKCDGCQECINVCPNEVLMLSDGKCDASGGGECEFCESCTGVCPTDSITITEM